MRKYNTDTGLDNFILRLKELNSDLEYFSNYIDSEHKVTLRCKKCGNIFERYASSTRQNKKIRCYECEKLETKRKKEAERLAREYIREKEKLLKQLSGTQTTFSVCKHCGTLFIGDRKYCSKRCSDRHQEGQHTRVRYEKAKDNGKIDYTITLDKLLKRDNNICYLCNKECNELDYIYQGNTFIAGNYYPSIDHVIPLSKGGTHTWDNVRLAHRICNTLKGNNT